MNAEACSMVDRICAELAAISAQQHALERRRAILRDAATRLRLGQHPSVVQHMVRVETERVPA